MVISIALIYVEASKVYRKDLDAATVGTIASKNTKYTIFPEPLGNPSFHLSTNDFEVVLRIKDLSILEWKRGKLKVKGRIPSDDVKRFLEWAKDDSVGINNWKFLIRTWNENNPKYRIDWNIPLPKSGVNEE
jgi:hypothetical protein